MLYKLVVATPKVRENSNDRLISVAPMMGWTDRHGRVLLRQINRDVWLYTEMITADALIHGPRERLLAFEPCEHPVALQVAGADPAKLAAAALLGADAGYDEINLNVGCPSSRVRARATPAARWPVWQPA